MTSWLDHNALFHDADAATRDALSALQPMHVPKGTTLFHNGDKPEAFVVLLSGRVSVHLTSQTGREILLYTVEPGQSCVQTTLGLLGDEPYSCEADADTDLTAVAIPRGVFLDLMARSDRFRHDVFRTLATRLTTVMHVLEQVAFAPIDARLAQALLDRAGASSMVEATHSDLARQIGSAREVVSRRLETWRAKGLITLERGQIAIVDRPAVARLSD
jgi:CRP/FNR family transcriptional regulator